MSGNLLDGLNPVTQTIDSGKALAKFLGLSEELPAIIPLANGARLTLSSKKDCYYMTTPKSCSCKAGQYGRICKHRESQSEAQAYQARKKEINAQIKAGIIKLEPVDSIMTRGGFRPVCPEEA
jgi:hypothetical protein